MIKVRIENDMPLIEVSPQLKKILERWGGKTEEEACSLFMKGLRGSLRECEDEILNYEMKYGVSFEEYKEKLEAEEGVDIHVYETEKDSMKWEDLIAEKKMWLGISKELLESLK